MNEQHHPDLHLEGVQALLQTTRFGRSLEIREITDSTNDDARAASNAGARDGHVVVADTQRKGRGSRGRQWDSPAGSDLYLSIVSHVATPLHEIAPLTLAVGLGVAEAVDRLLARGTGSFDAPPRAEIKWPNDVWVRGKKIAGVLVEGASVGETSLPLVIGIGLNVNREQFPDGLDTQATSLRLESGRPCARARVLATLLDHVERAVDRFVQEGAAATAREVDQRLCLRGQRARCDELSGVVLGLAASGALRLEVDGQPREIFAGTLRPLT